VALAVALAVALVLTLSACGDGKPKAPPAPKAPEVGVQTLALRSETLSSELPGRTSAAMSAEVRPQVSGIVQQRLFTEGAQVLAGQVLYQIDPSSYRAALASAKATLAKAQAAARMAAANAERNAELAKIDAVSRQVAQESSAQAAQTQADVAAAQAAVENAQINLAHTQVKAPIGGRVSLSAVTPGALVTANQATALTTIVQLDPINVDFTQSTAELLALRRDVEAGRYDNASGNTGNASSASKNALTVKLLLEDGSAYPQPGKLAFAGLIVNPGTGGVTLRATVPNPDGVLMPGMYVRALLPTGVQPKALLIPQQAVQRDPSGRANVWLLGEGDKVARTPITLSRAVGNEWLVEGGLKAGDRIVVDGFQRVRAGMAVKPVEAKTSASASASASMSASDPAAPASGAASASAPADAVGASAGAPTAAGTPAVPTAQGASTAPAGATASNAPPAVPEVPAAQSASDAVSGGTRR
jgi:membrane fusion protein (multidrug efflux system)